MIADDHGVVVGGDLVERLGGGATREARRPKPGGQRLTLALAAFSGPALRAEANDTALPFRIAE